MNSAQPSPLPTLAVITAARNEDAFIEQTIESVVAQTSRPIRWIIVSDGSTDRTDEIISRYAVQHSWITLLRMPARDQRNFAAKAHAVNAGYAALKTEAFDVVANLDADVTFAPDYFAFVLEKFVTNPRLGVAGTPYVEGPDPNGPHSCSHGFADLKHVSGPCQLFRRACFEEIGGYVPVKGGAVDWIAVRTARMKGWESRTFLGKTYWHHRKMGTAECGVLTSSFRYGVKAYSVGSHPVWTILQGFFKMRTWPWVLGGLYYQAGFIWASLQRQPRPVSPELMAFHRNEQMSRLRGILRRGRRQPKESVALPASSAQNGRDL